MKWAVAVLLEKVVEAEAQLLKDHADVASVVKPLDKAHTMVLALSVIHVQGVQYLQLQVSITECQDSGCLILTQAGPFFEGSCGKYCKGNDIPLSGQIFVYQVFECFDVGCEPQS